VQSENLYRAADESMSAYPQGAAANAQGDYNRLQQQQSSGSYSQPSTSQNTSYNSNTNYYNNQHPSSGMNGSTQVTSTPQESVRGMLLSLIHSSWG